MNKISLEKSIDKMKDFYALKPDAPIYQIEFGFYCKDRWISEGHISEDTDIWEVPEFGYDPGTTATLGGMGWVTAPFYPNFPEIEIEDRGEQEVIQDTAGRYVLYFKGRRNGFMPEYIDHPVKDMKSWEENCKWRLDPNTPERIANIENGIPNILANVKKGKSPVQQMIGGYMYLRSLIGPLDLMYKFYDEPELIHSCMQTWLELADATAKKHQEYIEIEELFLAEDICYNHGSLISPDMMREFLFPYYQQLIENIKSRQNHKNFRIQIDTDGFAVPVIDVYKEIGMNFMSPFEVASNCDVIEVGKQYPDLLIKGGIDKRILAESKGAIDREIERIMPVMKKRGGYIPTCDHGVPEEVSFENYLHYRKRMLDYAK